MTNLYSDFAKDFSSTRQAPWAGWKRLISQIPSIKDPNLKENSKLQTANSELKILDLGCGNGRFLKFLTSNIQYSISKYVGIDNAEELLEIAKNNIKNKTLNIKNPSKELQTLISKHIIFHKRDLESIDWDVELDQEFDLVVIFGVMHHIHSFEKRVELLQKAAKHLSLDGILAVTFWQFKDNESFVKKHDISNLNNHEADHGTRHKTLNLKHKKSLEKHIVDNEPINIEDKSLNSKLQTHNLKPKYTNNDYQLSFGKEGATRFAHHFSNEEIDEIVNRLELNVIDEFNSDGFENKMNRYVLVKSKQQISNIKERKAQKIEFE